MTQIFLIQRWGVYHWKVFRFKDGSMRDKFCIALVCKTYIPENESLEEIPFILPTSQWEKYERNPNWLVDTVILNPNESKFFPKKTILDLKNIQMVERKILKNAVKNGRLTFKGLLEEDICKKVEEGIKKAKTLSPLIKELLLCESLEGNS